MNLSRRGVLLGLVAGAFARNAKATLALKMRGKAHPIGPLIYQFGASALQGYGGIPTTETPGSSFTGSFAGFFTVDAQGHMVPAASGVVSSYGAAWTPPISSSFSIVGASGTAYPVVILPNAIFARPSPVAGHDDGDSSQLFVNKGNQLNKIFSLPGLLTEGGNVYLRDGHFNPSGNRNDFEIHSYYDGMTITIQSENVDTGLDPHTNPRLFHGALIGGLLISSSGADQKIVFRDIQFYHNNPTPGVSALVNHSSSGAARGIRFTNCFAGFGPDVSDARLGGSESGFVHYAFQASFIAVDHCRLKRVGVGINVIGDAARLGIATDNIIEEIILDAIDSDGVNVKIKDNLMFDFRGNSGRDGLHGDAIQLFGFQGDITYTGVSQEITGNYACDDNGVTKTQGISFFTNQTPIGGPPDPRAFARSIIEGNVSCLAGITGIQLSDINLPRVRFNLWFMDIARKTSSDYVQAIVNNDGGIANTSGGDFHHNAANTFGLSLMGSPGVTTPNASIGGTTPTNAQMDAAYPLLRAFLAGNVRTLAAFKAACVPANLLVASGGVKNADGTWDGPFKANGTKNDGLV